MQLAARPSLRISYAFSITALGMNYGIEPVPRDMMILDIGPETATRIAVRAERSRATRGRVLVVAVTDH